MKEEKSNIHLWDKLFKVIGDHFPEKVLRFVCEDEKVKYRGKYEQEKVVIESQIADLNFWIMDGRKKKLLNIEPYSEWKSSIPQRVFTRNGIITKALNYKYEVLSVVILLEKTPREGLYETYLRGKAFNKFSFPIIDFHNVSKILEEYPALAPLVLKVDRSYEREVIEVVKKDKLLSAMTVLVLNRLGMSQEEALKMTGAELNEFKEAFLEVPIMKDLWEENRTQGITQGRIEDTKDKIVRLIELRFKKPSKELKKKIEGIHSVEKLNAVFDKVALAEDLRAFEKKLDGLLKEKKD